MGKRILTEAGYEVVAVSNGAAAVKKIAEQKPDIIILDLYMPGYSGLEVCEKVRGSVATVKTPVLLTVGKMEPYRPEDANRVRADGVIVKPFEASDLLAIVKKFEERIVPPTLIEPIAVPEKKEEEDLPDFPIEPAAAARNAAAQATVDVPDHMASSSAFTDMLGTDSAEAAPLGTPEAASLTTPSRPGVPEYELPISWRQEEAVSKTEVELPPAAASTPEPAPLEAIAVVPAEPIGAPAPPPPPRPLQIPVYQEPQQSAPVPELMPTAAPSIGEIEIPRDPYLEEDDSEETANTVADAVDPNLVSSRLQEIPVASPSTIEAAEMAPVEEHFATPSRHPEAAPPAHAPEAAEIKAPEAVSDDDFEARVAAAMSAYNHEAEAAAPKVEPSAPVIEEHHTPEPVVQQDHSAAALEAEAKPEPGAPSIPEIQVFEYHPPVAQVAEHQGTQAVATSQQHEPQAAPAESPAATQPSEDVVLEEVETVTQSLASAAAAGSGSDRDTIAQAVHRVVERLKPELVEEILRELKSK